MQAQHLNDRVTSSDISLRVLLDVRIAQFIINFSLHLAAIQAE